MNKKDLILSVITVSFSVIIVTVVVSAATGGLLTPPIIYKKFVYLF